MNKKMIAYILLGCTVVGLIIYLVASRRKSPITEMAGDIDNRGAWSADDDDTANQIRALIPDKDKGWVDAIYTDRMQAGRDVKLLGGVPSKALTYYSTVARVAPSTAGKFEYEFGGVTQKYLWDEATMLAAYNLSETFKNRNFQF